MGGLLYHPPPVKGFAWSQRSLNEFGCYDTNISPFNTCTIHINDNNNNNSALDSNLKLTLIPSKLSPQWSAVLSPWGTLRPRGVINVDVGAPLDRPVVTALSRNTRTVWVVICIPQALLTFSDRVMCTYAVELGVFLPRFRRLESVSFFVIKFWRLFIITSGFLFFFFFFLSVFFVRVFFWRIRRRWNMLLFMTRGHLKAKVSGWVDGCVRAWGDGWMDGWTGR